MFTRRKFLEGLSRTFAVVTALGFFGIPKVATAAKPTISPDLKVIDSWRDKADAECPHCKFLSDLDSKGRCPACWGDVFGLCDYCGDILEEGFFCPNCDLEEIAED